MIIHEIAEFLNLHAIYHTTNRSNMTDLNTPEVVEETTTEPEANSDSETGQMIQLSTHELLNLLFERLMTTKPTDEPIEFWLQQLCLIAIISADAAVRIDNTLTDVVYGTDEDDEDDDQDEDEDDDEDWFGDEDEDEEATKGEDETTK